ncbi:ubiquitin carboxyl-terminal hydrolase 18-like [Chlorella sorokiniana]|uniref:Ubiquitin carboxyl-terminal hydrolase 18-like n=1 Tax=Chlorella sorokiniana TaxID=3076 RepID=A0A2P6TJ59_CHLSO|nr:ubiquitin carboxyl-terminal hydrolase 18-like [Chlorella sorokiniana]|eukprot:PRW39259.1 ubiquitin carboxyl-terminal hydrolase 18-like [Chlorella sorokiniana]
MDEHPTSELWIGGLADDLLPAEVKEVLGRYGTAHFVHMGHHPDPNKPLAYAKVTMGSIAEATHAKNALNGVYVDELCNPGEVLLIRFARIGTAAYSSGPTSPSYASPRARPFGRAGSQAEAAHSPRAAPTPTANGGTPARAASSMPSAHSGSSLASSVAGGSAAAPAPAPPLLPPPQRCGSCGAAESATLVLRRCSACKAVAYCTSECQLRDWTARHSGECGTLQGLARLLAAQPAVAATLKDALEAPGSGLGRAVQSLLQARLETPEQFYLPKPSLARYAGFEAVVGGTRLPLNVDRLVDANVLDGLFEEPHSGDVLGPGQGRTNISPSFAGASLLETCCFLRWLYQPDCAVLEEFSAAAAAGGLLGAARLAHQLDARLAHQLDAGSLLEKIGSHLIEAMPAATTAQLIDCLRLADSCELEALADTCIDQLASKLLAELPWPEPLPGQLGGCYAPTLVSLMGRMAASSAGVQETKVAAALADQKRTAEAALAEQKRTADAALADALAEQLRTAQSALAEEKRRATTTSASLAPPVNQPSAYVPPDLPRAVRINKFFKKFVLDIDYPAAMPSPGPSGNGSLQHILQDLPGLYGTKWTVTMTATSSSTLRVYLDSWHQGYPDWHRDKRPIRFYYTAAVLSPAHVQCDNDHGQCINRLPTVFRAAQGLPSRLSIQFAIEWCECAP